MTKFSTFHGSHVMRMSSMPWWFQLKWKSKHSVSSKPNQQTKEYQNNCPPMIRIQKNEQKIATTKLFQKLSVFCPSKHPLGSFFVMANMSGFSAFLSPGVRKLHGTKTSWGRGGSWYTHVIRHWEWRNQKMTTFLWQPNFLNSKPSTFIRLLVITWINSPFLGCKLWLRLDFGINQEFIHLPPSEQEPWTRQRTASGTVFCISGISKFFRWQTQARLKRDLDQHGTQQWRFGRWCSFSVGSFLIFDVHFPGCTWMPIFWIQFNKMIFHWSASNIYSSFLFCNHFGQVSSFNDLQNFDVELYKH